MKINTKRMNPEQLRAKAAELQNLSKDLLRIAEEKEELRDLELVRKLRKAGKLETLLQQTEEANEQNENAPVLAAE